MAERILKENMKLKLASALLFAALAFAADPAIPTVGQAAPDFTLPSQDGTRISLHDFKGKWVVLYFYPKDGTSGCTIEAHNFQRDQAKYDQKKPPNFLLGANPPILRKTPN